MTEKNLIKIYVNATSAKRVDIIIRHESTLCLKMIGSTGMKYMIEYRKSIEYVNRSYKRKYDRCYSFVCGIRLYSVY